MACPRNHYSGVPSRLSGCYCSLPGITSIAAAPARAVVPASQLSVSSSTVHPGDTVTITQTVTNILGIPLSSPVAQLLSTPGGLTSFTSLVSCSGALSCGIVNNGSGQPIGYQAILPNSLNPLNSLGDNAVIIWTLKILPTAPDLQETLQGRLLGNLDFVSDLLNGPTLIVDANADVAVSVTATPKLGVLSPTLDVAVTVTNNGPGQFLLGTHHHHGPGGSHPRRSPTVRRYSWRRDSWAGGLCGAAAGQGGQHDVALQRPTELTHHRPAVHIHQFPHLVGVAGPESRQRFGQYGLPGGFAVAGALLVIDSSTVLGRHFVGQGLRNIKIIE
jgi:hypothetical protein